MKIAMRLFSVGGLLLAGLVPCPIAAQALAEEESAPVKVSLRALGWDKTIRDLYLFSEDEYQRLIIPSGGMSLEYEYIGPPQIRFFRKGPTDADGDPTWLPATAPKVVEGGREYLFVFRETGEDTGRYAVAMHAANPSEFPPGAFRFFNFSVHPLACRLGSIEFTVPPGGSQIVPMDPPAENHFVTFLAHEVEGEWQLLFKTKWAWYPNKRSYVFVSSDPLTEETSLKIVEETMGWRETNRNEPSE